MSDPRPRPVLVVRASVGRWGSRLAWATVVVVLGSAAVLTDIVDGALRLVTQVTVGAAYAVMVAALAVVTVRLRSSLRSDGEALVVRGPFGASEVPFHDGITIGRWIVEGQRRPVVWVLAHGAPVIRVDGRIDPVRVEFFAARVGVTVSDEPGPPPEPADS
ncbi:MAG TPA: hypothetical protein VFM95_03545 [Microcella sp.]|nr:hypothetical protein [Microcella sp.]